jgi:hypothetical protein
VRGLVVAGKCNKLMSGFVESGEILIYALVVAGPPCWSPTGIHSTVVASGGEEPCGKVWEFSRGNINLSIKLILL